MLSFSRAVFRAVRPLAPVLRRSTEPRLRGALAPAGLRWMSDVPENKPDDNAPLERFSLSESRSRRLRESGITHFFPIQGESLVARAPTGSGKTLAYLLPLFERLERQKSEMAPGTKRNTPMVAIVSPTRELAVQISGQISKFSLSHQHATLVGGLSYQPQIQDLEDGAELIVGTPGRICDLMEKRNLSLSSIGTLVLDEADRMLEMGFEDEIQRIISQCPKEKQVLLFSATIPPWVQRAMRSFMKNPKVVNLVGNEQTATEIKHYYQVYNSTSEIVPLVSGLMNQPPIATSPEESSRDGVKAILFCETKSLCSELASTLPDSTAIHGDLSQSLRSRSLESFRSGRIRLLIATDVASRGLDIDNVSYVINLGLPRHSEDYVHRAGRTGRAGKSGSCVTLITGQELSILSQMSRKLGFPLEPLFSKADGASGKQSFLVQSRVQYLKNRLDKTQPMRDSESVIKALRESFADEDLLSRALASLAPSTLDLEPYNRFSRGDGGRRSSSSGNYRGERGDRGDRGDRFRSFAPSMKRESSSSSYRGNNDSSHRSQSSSFYRDSDSPIRDYSRRFDRHEGGSHGGGGAHQERERKPSFD